MKGFYRAVLLGLVIVLGNQYWVLAQNLSALQDTLVTGESIEEVTVRAFRTPYNLFSIPAPVNTISTKQLELGSALTPVEALNQVPGVLMHSGTYNTNRLTIRGIGSRTPYASNKIKAYFGEIPLSTGDGETTLEDLENTSIQSVEIIKGPASSLYGAGLAGVVLFHPKTVFNDFVQNKSTIASFGTFKNSVLAGLAKKKLKMNVQGSLLSSDGYRENNSTNRYNVLLNSVYAINEQSNFQVLLRTTKMKAYIPSSLNYETFINSPESAAGNWAAVRGNEDYVTAQLGVSFSRFTQNDGKISVAAFGNLKQLDELRPFNRLEESSRYVGWRMYWQKRIEVEQTQLTFTTGFEMFREHFDWATYHNDTNGLLSDNNEKRQYENLYAQMELDFNKKLFISAGINANLTRFNYTDYYLQNGDQSGKRNYQPVISPRLGLTYTISNNLAVFSNVSHGFSTPSFEETLLPDGVVNDDIKPESGWSFELGFRSKFKQIQLSGSYSRIYIDNLLVARRTAEDAYIGVNAGQSVHPGFETELRWNIIQSGSYPHLTLVGNATFSDYHFTDFIDEGINYSGMNLPGTAKDIVNAGFITQLSKNISFNAWYRFTDKMALDDANSDYTDSYGISNGEVQYQGTKGAFTMELKAGVQNIFDVHYASMLAVNAPSFGGRAPRYYYPGIPRNFYVTLVFALVDNK